MGVKRKRVNRRQVERRSCWLVQDWRKMWKWFSVQLLLLIAGAQGTLALMPTLKDYLHPTLWHWLMAGLAVMAILARIINQAPKEQ